METPLKYNDKQRKEYLNMIDKIGRNWLDVFRDNEEFYSAEYWDLLTKIWRRRGSVKRAEALKFMTSVKSVQTAGKYIDKALQEEVLIKSKESEDKRDKRSTFLELSEEIRKRMDLFFDNAVTEIKISYNNIYAEGKLP